MGMGVGFTGVSDYMDDGKINKSMNEYLANAGGGAIAGGILGAGGFMMAEATLASSMALGGTSAMAGDMTSQLLYKGSIDNKQTLKVGAIAALTAGLFYGGAKLVGGIKNSITSKGNSQNVNTAQLNDDVVKGGVDVVTKPNQLHHFATNKSTKYTSQFEDITKKYGLDLDDVWNKELMPHQGRHPNAYHDWMLEQMQSLDSVAKGNKDAFLKMFEDVKKTVIDNPDMLRKMFWE